MNLNNNYSIIVINEMSGFQNASSAWAELLEDCPYSNPFLTYEWQYSWWEAYGSELELFILLVYLESKLIGIAPLCIENKIIYFTNYRIIKFIGDGSHDSDYLNIISNENYEKDNIISITNYLNENTSKWDVLTLREIPLSSLNVNYLKINLSNYSLLTESIKECCFINLPNNWDEYLSSLKPRMRTKLRSIIKRKNENKILSWESLDSKDYINTKLQSLYDLHTKRWNMLGEIGVFKNKKRILFYKLMAGRFLENNHLRLDTLIFNGKLISHQFNIVYGNKLYLLQEGFDVKYADIAPGNILRTFIIKDCIEKGINTYDFLSEVTKHKMSWGSEVKHCVDLVYCNNSHRGNIFYVTSKLVIIFKNFFKIFIPNILLKCIR